MTLGRTSAFIFAATALGGSIPGVAASCWIDSDGYEYCDGLSYTVRIIIGLSVSIFCIAILTLIAYRRRRAAQANVVYLQQAPQVPGGVNGAPYGPNGVPPSMPPQYPTQYNGPPTTGFGQPVTSPHQNYGPPSGGPPVFTVQK